MASKAHGSVKRARPQVGRPVEAADAEYLPDDEIIIEEEVFDGDEPASGDDGEASAEAEVCAAPPTWPSPLSSMSEIHDFVNKLLFKPLFNSKYAALSSIKAISISISFLPSPSIPRPHSPPGSLFYLLFRF